MKEENTVEHQHPLPRRRKFAPRFAKLCSTLLFLAGTLATILLFAAILILWPLGFAATTLARRVFGCFFSLLGMERSSKRRSRSPFKSSQCDRGG
jgi:hypothetical protein